MEINFFKQYKKYLYKDGYIEADKFKNTMIPDILYKYFPCFENRLSSLSNQKLWLAQHEAFNDPHEFEFMFIEKEKFAEAKLLGEGWDIIYNYYDKRIFDISYNEAIQFMQKSSKLISISCFTTNPNNDYFWSDYANNHNGFCIEYKINKKNNFYPVIYTDEKVEISDVLKTLIIDTKKTIIDEHRLEQENSQKYSVISTNGLNYISYLYFNYCCKGLKWKEEDEYRIVFANDEIQTTQGKEINYKDLSISANKIFIGKNCSDEDRKRLKEIANKFKIEYVINKII